MRVLFVTRKWPPAVGGMETYSYELVQELKKLAEVDVLALAGKEGGAPPSKLDLIKFFASGCFKTAFGKTYDVVHIGDMVLWPMAFAAAVFKPKTKTVITAHGLDILFGYRDGALAKIYRVYIKLAAALITAKTTVITNSRATAQLCLDAGFQTVTPVALGTNHAAKGLPKDLAVKPFVLFVGRLVKRKGASWFIDNVLPKLPKGIDFKVAGPKWDSEEEAAVLAGNRTTYLGLVPAEELTRLRQEAIAVVMPNISLGVKDFEGFGLTAPEAAAEGGVLIASAVEGVTDAVVDGQTGFLIEAENTDAWVAKITEIKGWSLAKRLAFVKNSQDQVKTHYSWARVAQQTFEAYKK